MSRYARAEVTAVLGPTNTGKTHLAVERMCAHSSGMMGFPLRLLAREIYDRIVAQKGAHQVALITGEEKIVPPQARWFCCTAESMPIDGDFAFVALDEAQLGIDPERGHIFTDRMLNVRGREETMILGSAALTPIVRALLPEAEIISRPRFSTLSYAGVRKLSRLPRRSAVVAFSVPEVYAVAEMLRRHRGGAAVVMGALSPATRNAQVAMFMNGDVDYLVATDAIGMGLNLDVSHVAFASLRKFDGQRTRRLTLMEMAQIAGRAGRHQKDGTFGSLGGEDEQADFRADEILAIEGHHFPPIHQVYWRRGDPSCVSIDTLISDLEERPTRPELMAAPEVSDLAVLRYLADDPAVRARARGTEAVRRLWDVCGLPDFQKLGADHHARLVSQIWRFLSEGNGHVPRDWFAQTLARLDNLAGDIDILSGRLTAVRTWSYIAHRADWLAHPVEMAERTRALEQKLSDALHASLTQRFVDRRTSVLLRDTGLSAHNLPVEVDGEGAVLVDGEPIGHLHGFRFVVDPLARGSDRRMLLAAAEKRLGKILMIKVDELVAAPDADIHLEAIAGSGPTLVWSGTPVATLLAGNTLLQPEVRLEKPVVALGQEPSRRVAERLAGWMKTQYEKHLLPLTKIVEQAALAETPAPVRAFLAQLADAGGILARTDIDPALALLDKEQRQMVRKLGVTIGVLDIYHPALLKPGSALWRMALMSARRSKPMLPTPPAGAVLLNLAEREAQMGARIAGFRGVGGDAQLRVDMIERVARGAHEAIARDECYDISHPLIVSLGLSDEQFRNLMRSAGFRPAESGLQTALVVPGEAAASEENQAVPVEAPGAEGEAGPTVFSQSVAEPSTENNTATAPVSDEAATSAEEPLKQGANWVFRGRQKPRPHSHSGGGRGDGEHRKSKGPKKMAGRPKERQAEPGRFARSKPDSRPAGGGAFAGLAALLGQDE